MVTAVSGGIGCGKSVVCRILQTLGYEVYDCDSRAKAIMDADAGIKLWIAEEISRDVIVELECGFQQINRKRLAEIVFNDEAALSKLNAIVHSAVRADIGKWICNNLTTETVERPHLFIETAILMESGLDKMVDDVWEVCAPENLRIERAMKRDNASRHQIEARIRNQQPLCYDEELVPEIPVNIITNDDRHPVLPRILELLDYSIPMML